MAAGLDSLGSVEFVNVLSRRLHLILPATLIFDYPTAEAVSHYLHTQMSAAAAGPAADDDVWPSVGESWAADPAQQLAAAGRAPPRAVAVLAMAEQPLQGIPAVPTYGAGGAVSTMDAITCIPVARWDVEEAEMGVGAPGCGRFGAFMEGVELFDTAIFGLATAEATITDPQHRLLLRLTGKCTALVLTLLKNLVQDRVLAMHISEKTQLQM